jgi:hypothetical protein
MSCTQCGTPNPSFFLFLIKGGTLGDAVSVRHFCLLMEKRFPCDLSCCANVRLNELRKKASLARIYCEVREETEESIEGSRTMNCLGLLAH